MVMVWWDGVVDVFGFHFGRTQDRVGLAGRLNFSWVSRPALTHLAVHGRHLFALGPEETALQFCHLGLDGGLLGAHFGQVIFQSKGTRLPSTVVIFGRWRRRHTNF
jgi:hypothetical protein